ncbi:MAG: endo alpha-1,4 polygalactosaminidase, partial [Gammaproteobacteria bacterium]|nr:endo alpha-1,4 polygalactosaminidase [Gammaproteobacteria bacterium]
PDNMDGYINNSGFNLTAADQLDFNRFVAIQAHLRGLAVGLKNDVDQINELVDYFDFAVNEQCYEYNECATLIPFIINNKPVLHIEYESKYISRPLEREKLCAPQVDRQFSTLILPLELDNEFRLSCN